MNFRIRGRLEPASRGESTASRRERILRLKDHLVESERRGHLDGALQVRNRRLKMTQGVIAAANVQEVRDSEMGREIGGLEVAPILVELKLDALLRRELHQ